MPGSRIELRLGELSHAELLKIATAGCEASAKVKNVADDILAAHKPLPQWAVDGVLFDPDLLKLVLAPLELKDGAAAAVCSDWAAGWKATSDGRALRPLRQVPFDGLPPELQGSNPLPNITADEQFLYVADDHDLKRLTHDGTLVATYTRPVGDGYPPFWRWSGIVCGGGLLFCVLSDPDYANDEIIALDAQTGQPCYKFGLGVLDNPHGLAVAGEELFVCDTFNDCLQVFSLAGEHRRSITGDWERPGALCFVKDRLYLVELTYDGTDRVPDPRCGARIIVLSLQGDILQEYYMNDNPVDGLRLCYFDGKLLATANGSEFGGNNFVGKYEDVSVMALAGACA